MDFKVGQIWVTNLPGKIKLQIYHIHEGSNALFPIELIDNERRKYYATYDGFLKALPGPNGIHYKLVMFVSEGDITKLSYKEQKIKSAKERAIHNRKVIYDYRLKGPKYDK